MEMGGPEMAPIPAPLSPRSLSDYRGVPRLRRGAPSAVGGMGGPSWPPMSLGGLVADLADLEPVAIAVRPRQQGRPAAEPPEVPGLVTLAVIGPGDGDHLRRIPGDEHRAQRRPLHFHAIAGAGRGWASRPCDDRG